MAPTFPIEFVGQKESRKCCVSQLMGKSRRYSMGNSTGFVPDHRHAVSTMAESEGFGSSARFDTEMSVSDDSTGPSRKHISLNMDGHGSFGVPMQVLSLSKMSRSDKKDLELRLKMELEQVRILLRKVASMSSDVVLLSPAVDVRSCSAGQNRPPLEGIHWQPEMAAPQSKRRAPQWRGGARNKKGTSGRTKPAVPTTSSSSMLMKQCEVLLTRMMSHQFAWVFNTPVDVVKLNLPDYLTIIKHPMDLGTVKSKIASREYSTPLEFAADVRLTFSNAMTYNPRGHDVHFMAETLSKYFESRWKSIEKKLPTADVVDSIPHDSGNRIELGVNVDMPPLKKKKTMSAVEKINPEPVQQVMSDEEKQKLSTELVELLGELPETIIDFLKQHSNTADQTAEDEIEIDIDSLSDKTLFKLRKLLDEYLLGKPQSQAKAEPCEMEVINESGFSNSSLQLGRGNDVDNEDIDIVGGSDPPVSSYPCVQIEKDNGREAAHKNSKCSSSSSSSGESGSSSDSAGSSSGSEPDVAKVAAPVTATKENVESGDKLDQKGIASCEPDSGNQPGRGLAQTEVSSEQQSATVEADDHQEGDSAPSERQVSPEKLYRAALLRSRFADTIFRAREKALEKGEKRDPEQLRIEREELERRQKEEKARLQAEAKAAEEAQRKAEAEAAAEAKRKRELEREAARQALLQMEKAADTNESSQFMEDLEMLRTANDEHVPCFLEEDSPDHYQNALGSFKLQGSNPLEQLGLYMKQDDDEEDEEVAPPQRVPEAVKDVEEGEID